MNQQEPENVPMPLFVISAKLAAQDLTDLEAATAYLEALKLASINPYFYGPDETMGGRYYFGHDVIRAFEAGAVFKSLNALHDTVRYWAGSEYLETLQPDGAECETDAPYYLPPVIITAFQAGVEWQHMRTPSDAGL